MSTAIFTKANKAQGPPAFTTAAQRLTLGSSTACLFAFGVGSVLSAATFSNMLIVLFGNTHPARYHLGTVARSWRVIFITICLILLSVIFERRSAHRRDRLPAKVKALAPLALFAAALLGFSSALAVLSIAALGLPHLQALRLYGSLGERTVALIPSGTVCGSMIITLMINARVRLHWYLASIFASFGANESHLEDELARWKSSYVHLEGNMSTRTHEWNRAQQVSVQIRDTTSGALTSLLAFQAYAPGLPATSNAGRPKRHEA